MNDNIRDGRWTQLKGKLKEEWGKLTDDELEQTQGNVEQIKGKIQEIYGKQAYGANEKLNSILESINKSIS